MSVFPSKRSCQLVEAAKAGSDEEARETEGTVLVVATLLGAEGAVLGRGEAQPSHPSKTNGAKTALGLQLGDKFISHL
jgi:hypothetical protein